jgi:hypothetical protein
MAVPVGADPANGFAVLEIPADEVDVTPTGALAFWRYTPDGDRTLTVSFRAGYWTSLVIQSALDGAPIGYRVVRAQPAAGSATPQIQRPKAPRDIR